jgi:hypothetical protein
MGGQPWTGLTCCLQCGKRMVPVPSYVGRTELKCVFCDRLDPMEMAEPHKWVDGPLGIPISDQSPERTRSHQQASGTDGLFL